MTCVTFVTVFNFLTFNPCQICQLPETHDMHKIKYHKSTKYVTFMKTVTYRKYTTHMKFLTQKIIATYFEYVNCFQYASWYYAPYIHFLLVPHEIQDQGEICDTQDIFEPHAISGCRLGLVGGKLNM